MARKINEEKREFSFVLYMNGELQKNICERACTTSKTLQRWIEDGGWKEKRSAKNITRTELVNKTLLSISRILDNALAENTDDKNFSAISDQLAKLATFIEKLDKRNSVIDAMDTFLSFNNWLLIKAGTDKSLRAADLQLINKLQDRYVNERLATKR